MALNTGSYLLQLTQDDSPDTVWYVECDRVDSEQFDVEFVTSSDQ